jgi:circadian clock protein KaiC
MAHSNQVREFLLTPDGIELTDVYLGPDGVLTGSARLAQESRERVSEQLRRQEAERKRREIERRRQALEAQIAALRLQFESEEEELERSIAEEDARRVQSEVDRGEMARLRKAEVNGNAAPPEENGP